MDDTMKELLEEFISESKEHLSTIEEDFLELEQQKDNPDKKLVNKIFRAIHTIKGTSGFFGLETITSLAHTMENILSLVRNGEMVAESDTIDTLLTGADIINSMIDDIDHSNEFDITDILAKLNVILEGDGKPSESLEEMEMEVDIKDTDGKAIGFKIDLFELNSILSNYKFLYLLRLDLNELASYGIETPVQLIKKMLKNGLIADTQTTTIDEDLSALPIGPIFFEVVYATNLQRTTIIKKYKLTDEEIVELDQNFEGAVPKEINVEVVSEPKKVEETSSTEIVEVKQDVVPTKQKSNKDVVKVKNKISPTKQPTKKAHVDTSVRIQIDLLDKLMRLAGELVLVRNQQVLLTENQSSNARKNSQRLDLVTTELQEAIMMTRMQPAGNVFNKFHRVVRDIGKNLNKQIEIHISGNEVELDKTILESLADPLTHIIRNSCDHGIELPEVREATGKEAQGNIWLSAFHEGGQINIQIKDDGKGIDPEVIRNKAFEKGLKTEAELDNMSEKELANLVMMAGFSTAEKVSSISGRGVGMDVVKEGIERLNGSIELDSVKGEGTTLNLRLPLTLAIIPSLIVRIGKQRYAVPQVNLEELVTLYDDDVNNKIERANDLELFRLRETLLPMVRLNEVLLHKEKFTAITRSNITEKYFKLSQSNNAPKTLSFAVLKVGALKFGLIVDEVIGTEEIVVKPMHSVNKSISIYTGATIMGDGSVALILDADGIAKHTGVTAELAEEEEVSLKTMNNYQHVESQTILLFKNGPEEQFAAALPLIRRIEKIKMSDIEQIGHKEFITVDNMSTKVLRLDHILSVSSAEESEEAFLLLPKHIHKPFGILVTSLVDIENSTIDLNTESYTEDGLLGTTIMQDKMTLFIDIYRLIEISEPDWFADRRQNSAEHDEIKRVLLLEDSSFFKELVKGYLVSEGYEVDTVENGVEGLQMINEVDYDYDIIVSDIEMPEMDGIEFIKEIRKEKSTKNTRALALSSLGSELDKTKARDAGFDRYEVKMERELFLTTISEMLNGWDKLII